MHGIANEGMKAFLKAQNRTMSIRRLPYAQHRPTGTVPTAFLGCNDQSLRLRTDCDGQRRQADADRALSKCPQEVVWSAPSPILLPVAGHKSREFGPASSEFRPTENIWHEFIAVLALTTDRQWKATRLECLAVTILRKPKVNRSDFESKSYISCRARFALLDSTSADRNVPNFWKII
jgi:hypothetical protein